MEKKTGFEGGMKLSTEEIFRWRLVNVIREILNTLNEKERNIIALRYGLSGDYPKTLEEVGRIYGVTRERVRQIEAKALRKLRFPARTKQMIGFLEMSPSEKKNLKRSGV